MIHVYYTKQSMVCSYVCRHGTVPIDTALEWVVPHAQGLLRYSLEVRQICWTPPHQWDLLGTAVIGYK